MEQLLQLILTTVAAVAAAVAAYFSHLDRQKTGKVADAVHSVHLDVNGRLSELIEAARVAAHAVGKAEGLAEARAGSKP